MIKELLERKQGFSNKEIIISNYMLEHTEEIFTVSSRMLASMIGVDVSTLIRFTQKLGYDKYANFIVSFQKEYEYNKNHYVGIDPNKPFDVEDSYKDVMDKLGSLYHEIIDDTLNEYNNQQYGEFINRLMNAKIIYLISSNKEIAIIFKNKMNRIGKIVIVENQLDEAFHFSSFKREDVIYLFISQSGETKDIIKIAKLCKINNANRIAITSVGNNTLSKLVDCCIRISSKEKLIENAGNFSYSLSLLLILDSIYASIMKANYDIYYKHKVNIAKIYEQHRHSKNPELE